MSPRYSVGTDLPRPEAAGKGLVHRATLSPSKQELVAAWLPTRGWATGIDVTTKVAEYRFDDPAGEVGVETILFAADDGATVQVPLTYRGAPLDGADGFLIGTSEHSVLGTRWVYDGCIDPVWATTLATAILTGGTQEQMYLEQDGQRIDVPPRMTVQGSGRLGSKVPDLASVDSVRDEGMTTVVRAGDVELVVARVVGATLEADETLVGQGATRVRCSRGCVVRHDRRAARAHTRGPGGPAVRAARGGPGPVRLDDRRLARGGRGVPSGEPLVPRGLRRGRGGRLRDDQLGLSA